MGDSGDRKETIKQVSRGPSKPQQRPIMESKEFDNLILMQLNRKGLEGSNQENKGDEGSPEIKTEEADMAKG